jgi:hypothetical protein
VLWSTYGSWAEEYLDRLPPVHGLVAGEGLVEGEFEVEDLARVDLAVPDQLDELGQEAAHRGGAAVQVHVREEQFLARQLDVMATPT